MRLIHTMACVALLGACDRSDAPDDADERPPQFLNSGKVLPATLPFSEAVRVGNTIYLSGQIGIAPGNNESRSRRDPGRSATDDGEHPHDAHRAWTCNGRCGEVHGDAGRHGGLAGLQRHLPDVLHVAVSRSQRPRSQWIGPGGARRGGVYRGRQALELTVVNAVRSLASRAASWARPRAASRSLPCRVK